MKKVMLFVVMLIVVSFGKIIGKSVGNAATQSDRDAAYVIMVNKMNKDLPQFVDKSTRLDSVNYTSSNIFYKYTMVDVLSSQVDPHSFKNTMTSRLTKSVCELDTFKAYKKDKIKIHYMYSDKLGNLFSSIQIDAANCR